MSATLLQNKIKDFITKKGLNVASMERAAGLKTNLIRNILRGQSKRPTMPTLQALALLMECTVQDLMEAPSPQAPARTSTPWGPPLERPDLLQEALATILESAAQKNIPLAFSQLTTLLNKVYHYSLQKSPPALDKDFVLWALQNL